MIMSYNTTLIEMSFSICMTKEKRRQIITSEKSHADKQLQMVDGRCPGELLAGESLRDGFVGSGGG